MVAAALTRNKPASGMPDPKEWRVILPDLLNPPQADPELLLVKGIAKKETRFALFFLLNTISIP